MAPMNDGSLVFVDDPHSATNFVDRMHRECAPRQWLRELLVNSIEAIHATHESGKILVHAIDQDMGDDGLVRKLAITDTGEGMPENQLHSLFQLALTSRGHGNYGIGAKISALPMNPAGLIYRSKVEDGDVAELIWHRTGQYGVYAAAGWDDETGETRYVTPPSVGDSAYGLISQARRGTQVVLCGENPKDDTCKTLGPSKKVKGNLHWVIRELNFRFWEIPQQFEIRVENATSSERQTDVRDYRIRGGKHAMESFAGRNGVVELEDLPFKVHWFLLNESVAGKRNSKTTGSRERRSGTMYREPTGIVEIYALRRLNRGAAIMNDFGIYVGAKRVVLLVEPTQQDQMEPTTARNDLRIEGDQNVSAMYREIGREFTGLMADQARPLAAYVREQLSGLESTSDRNKLKDVIARAAELYQIEDFRKLARGAAKVSEGEDGDGEKGDGEEGSSDPEDQAGSEYEPTVIRQPPAQRKRTSRPQPRTQPRPLSDSNGAGRAEPVMPDIEPKDFTWEPNRGDRYAVTNYETNTQKVVIVNTEGETYLRLLAFYKSRPDFADFPSEVEKVVQGKCEATLQLAIFTLEREFLARTKSLGEGFEEFFRRNGGRVSLDVMASKELRDVTTREIKNLVSKAKSAAAAGAKAESSLASS